MPARDRRGPAFGMSGGSSFLGGPLTAGWSAAPSGGAMMAGGGYTSASPNLTSTDLRTGPNSTPMSPTSAIIVERRRAGRKLVSETVLLSLPGQITPQPCDLRDLTALGAGLLLERFNLLPIEFNLSFDNFRTALACRLVWRDRDRGGVEFRP
jgi:hypothetical protein